MLTRPLLALAFALLAAGPAAAQPEPEPYGTNDAGGIRNVLPPGSRGLSNAVELGAFLATGVRPAHSSDQLPLYRDLIAAPRPFTADTLATHFKDAGFGVKGAVDRRYSPRDDVTITRDDEFGVPHIYSDTRAGAMFGIGYATAEDRLFFMDIFRHLGRAQLSSFAGGAPANRAFDALMWSVAPYSEEELTRQTQVRPRGFEDEADRLREDLAEYLAGVNAYIAEARLDPTKMPGEYAAINDLDGPDDFVPADVVATAAVAGAIFGVGGGEELESALALQAARKRFGRRRGERVWQEFRSVDDPEAVAIVHRKRFPYALHPRKRRGAAIPNPDSVEMAEILGKAEAPGSTTRALMAFPSVQSNALLVSARESESGRPLAVFGPQTGYFSPQVLVEQDVHAPGYDARGVAFPGVNLFVQLGRGRDYAWSATTSAQDIVDTFAVPLCDKTHYRFRGRCRKIEVLERTNSWDPSAADQTPAGTETLRVERTQLGIVIARGEVRGRPVLFTRLRSTYGHETDSGLAFSYFNDPGRITGPRRFQRAAALVPFTFNWFYADSEHIAYQNAGANPRRPRGVDPSLPVRARFEWRRWEPGESGRSLVETSTPARTHPRVVDQRYIVDWNGKQARGYGAADGNWGYGPVYRSNLLDDRVRRLVAGRRKATLPELTEAMADAATVDLRGDAVLPWALRVLGSPRDEELREAVGRLREWRRAGAHRRDEDGDGAYEHAQAIQIMDAWWPRWVEAQFRPVLGKRLFEAMTTVHPLDNHPNNHGDHVGSAWQDGWYSFAQKDLRAVLGRRVRGRWSRTYCGSPLTRGPGPVVKRCRRALLRSLEAALEVDAAAIYADDPVCAAEDRDGEQACFDAIWHRPLGGITQPLIPWQNRPTFQQVVEIPGGR
ncbi:MAG TPA: penicillin acylase family protein [Thermoleophilaceae bacterium]|nr:penicillin acylase family protein [Thermoleophilaceae bacterium]